MSDGFSFVNVTIFWYIPHLSSWSLEYLKSQALYCWRRARSSNETISSPICLSLSDLIHCTNEMNVNIPQLADSLFERTTNTSWVVVFKSLITTHHLMVYGNEVRPRSDDRSASSAAKCLHRIWTFKRVKWRHSRLFGIKCVINKYLCVVFVLSYSVLSSTWPQGTHYSTSVIFWIKVGYKVTFWL